jgi:hypothetical protein
VPGVQIPVKQVLKKADEDSPMWKGFRFEARFWVGIRVGRCGMYTGTLITDLMAVVERAEQRAQQKRMSEERVSEEMDLRRLFDLPSSQQTESIFAGAA